MKLNKLKTGLVVVNYNDYKTTIKFIDSIKDYKSIDLIVVVDNCSTDGSFKRLSKYDNASVKVIKTDKNGGYGYGNNVGIKYTIECLGKCNIIISNPDIEVPEFDLKELLSGLNSDDECALIAPVILENGQENKGWKLPTVLDDTLLNLVFINRYLRKKLLLYKPEWYNSRYARVDCVSGCFFVIKSNIIEQINYFDEDLFLYYEENVLGKKISKINKKILIDMKAKVIHHHSVSINNSISRINKYKILKQSQMYYHKKYNNANVVGKSMLYLTNKLSLFVLYIYYLCKYGRKK